MGRKSLQRERKQITAKVRIWLAELLIRLQHEDLAHLTMDDLARLAGKSKSTLYEYFESKEEILAAVCQARTLLISDSVSEKFNQDLSTVQQYEQLVEAFAEGTDGISFHFLQNIKKHYPNAWTVIDEFTDRFVTLLKEHYKRGIAEGIYNPISVELLGQIDKHFVIHVVTNPDLLSDEQYTLSKLVRDYLTLRLTGLLRR